MTQPDAAPAAIETYLSRHRAELAESTLDLLSFDTRNPPGDTTAAIGYLDDALTDLGLDTTRYQSQQDRPNIVARIPGTSDRTLLFNGHVDTVGFDAEEWSVDPLGERDGDRIYGRGATDMKGPLAAMLQVARAFVETDTTPPVTLAFAFVSDEETGGDKGAATLLEQCDIHADGCVIGETTSQGARHSITVADRGSIWLSLEATGEAAHGSRPMLGENAIDALQAAIGEVREFLGAVEIELAPSVAAIVEESIAYYTPELGESAARALFEHPTVNLGVIDGGDMINTVPSRAHAGLDIRLTAGVDSAAILADIRDLLDAHDRVDIADVSWSVGSYTPLDDPIVRSVSRVAAETTDRSPARRSATGGGDAKKFRNAGVPTVEFAVGTDTVHAVDEFTTRTALETNAHMYAAIPSAFATATR